MSIEEEITRMTLDYLGDRLEGNNPNLEKTMAAYVRSKIKDTGEEIKREAGVYSSQRAVEWWKLGAKVRIDSTDTRKIQFGKDIDAAVERMCGKEGV